MGFTSQKHNSKMKERRKKTKQCTNKTTHTEVHEKTLNHKKKKPKVLNSIEYCKKPKKKSEFCLTHVDYTYGPDKVMPFSPRPKPPRMSHPIGKSPSPRSPNSPQKCEHSKKMPTPRHTSPNISPNSAVPPNGQSLVQIPKPK